MAKIDPIRRAEIGREKRLRTRAQLVAAASALFSRQVAETVTVDDVVKEAGLAKGTFYVHFDGLDALTSAVADDLVRSFDELLQPVRLSMDDPAKRIAFGCGAFLDKALDDPQWATMVARMVSGAPKGAESARQRLIEDVSLVIRDLEGSPASAELNAIVVFGIMLQVVRGIGEGQVSASDRPQILRAILRAIGLGTDRVNGIVAQVPGQLSVVKTA